MSSKSREAHVAAINTISEEAGGMSLARVLCSVLCDFEDALRDAFEECFYGIEVTSWWFHFAQVPYLHLFWP